MSVVSNVGFGEGRVGVGLKVKVGGEEVLLVRLEHEEVSEDIECVLK